MNIPVKHIKGSRVFYSDRHQERYSAKRLKQAEQYKPAKPVSDRLTLKEWAIIFLILGLYILVSTLDYQAFANVKGLGQ